MKAAVKPYRVESIQCPACKASMMLKTETRLGAGLKTDSGVKCIECGTVLDAQTMGPLIAGPFKE